MPVIEANGYRYDTKTGKLTRLYNGKYYGFSLDVTQTDAKSLIAAAITATRAEPIEVRYRWEDNDQKYVYSLIALGEQWGEVYGQNPTHVDFFQKFSAPAEFDTEPEARQWLVDQTQDQLSAQLGKQVVMVEESTP